jgi:TolA-binding protein
MAGRRNRRGTNAISNDLASANPRSNTPPIDNRLATNSDNQELNRRMKTLEELLNNRLNQENNQIKQLQDKIEKLEAQAIQHQMQIQHLEEKVMSK